MVFHYLYCICTDNLDTGRNHIHEQRDLAADILYAVCNTNNFYRTASSGQSYL